MSRSQTPTNRKVPDDVIWIDEQEQLEQLIKTLQQEQLVAVDTESDSLYSYFEKVCLVQFSTTTTDYLVDPLRVNILGLGSFFADSSIQKVFHAAEYDFLSLKRDYGFSFNNLFDTMIAARVLGWSRYGLSSLLSEQFDVKLDKRFQRYNWSQRPLSKKALNYARLDTHFLLPLREIQMAELKQKNRLTEALAAFKRETLVEPTAKAFDPDDFWRIKGARDLGSRQQAVLRELFILRDQIARNLDRPPFKVMTNSTLIRLSKEQPGHTGELSQVKGVGKTLVRYDGTKLLKAIERGQNAPSPQYQSNQQHHPDNSTLSRYETLRQWRNSLAAQRGVEPDVIMSNSKLMDIARRNPKSLSALVKAGVLGDWQFETYGKTVLNVLKGAS